MSSTSFQGFVEWEGLPSASSRLSNLSFLSCPSPDLFPDPSASLLFSGPTRALQCLCCGEAPKLNSVFKVWLLQVNNCFSGPACHTMSSFIHTGQKVGKIWSFQAVQNSHAGFSFPCSSLFLSPSISFSIAETWCLIILVVNFWSGSTRCWTTVIFKSCFL